MNCNNFEAIISDLAREQMLEANLRESALLHMEECEACAARLETERALTGGLRSLAASMERCEVPASVEANLLAEFRRRAGAAAQAAPVIVEMPQRVTRWQRWYPQAVAAAVLLVFAIGGASMLRLRQGERPDPQPNAATDSKKAETEAVAKSQEKTTPSQSEGASVASPTTDSPDNGEQRGRKLSQNELIAIIGAPVQRRTAYPSVPKNRVNDSVKTPTSGEIATDFMPVSYGDNLNEIENGRIVRVEMPRSALAQFGLPVNMDRAGERIKADVLIGEDGMARAIRFVR